MGIAGKSRRQRKGKGRTGHHDSAIENETRWTRTTMNSREKWENETRGMTGQWFQTMVSHIHEHVIFIVLRTRTSGYIRKVRGQPWQHSHNVHPPSPQPTSTKNHPTIPTPTPHNVSARLARVRLQLLKARADRDGIPHARLAAGANGPHRARGVCSRGRQDGRLRGAAPSRGRAARGARQWARHATASCARAYHSGTYVVVVRVGRKEAAVGRVGYCWRARRVDLDRDRVRSAGEFVVVCRFAFSSPPPPSTHPGRSVSYDNGMSADWVGLLCFPVEFEACPRCIVRSQDTGYHPPTS